MEITIQQQKKPEAKPPVTPAPAAQPSGEVHTPTAEELVQQTNDLYKSMGWGEPPPPKPEKKDGQPIPAAAPSPAPPAGAQTPPAPEGSAPPASGAQPEPEPQPRREPTTAEIISRTARETAREVAQVIRPAEEPQPSAPAPTELALSEDDTDDLRVLQYLERTLPAKYQGAPQRFLDFVKANYKYQDDWMAANPGKEFDATADEYQQFLADNQPDIDTRALDRARIDMAAEEKVKKILQPEQEAKAREQAWQRELPKISKQISSHIVDMVGAVNSELAKLVTDDKGNPVLTDESIAKIEAADPIARQVLDEVTMHELEPVILELEKTGIPELGFRLDPKGNPLHASIAGFIGEKERDLADGPAEARQLDGKQWISLDDYARRMTEINRGKASERDQRIRELNSEYWTLSIEMVQGLWTDRCAKEARKRIDKLDGMAKRKYKPGNEAGAAAPAAAAAAQPTTTPPGPTPAGYRPRPPAGGGQADVVSAVVPGAQPAKSFGEEAASVHFAR